MIDATGFELEPTPWTRQAACAGTDPNLWFPEKAGDSIPEAKAICARCPVSDECLAYAIRWTIQYGIWGGLNTRQRNRLGRRNLGRPKRIPAPHGSTTRYARGCHCQECRNAHWLYVDDYRAKP